MLFDLSPFPPFCQPLHLLIISCGSLSMPSFTLCSVIPSCHLLPAPSPEHLPEDEIPGVRNGLRQKVPTRIWVHMGCVWFTPGWVCTHHLHSPLHSLCYRSLMALYHLRKGFDVFHGYMRSDFYQQHLFDFWSHVPVTESSWTVLGLLHLYTARI